MVKYGYRKGPGGVIAAAASGADKQALWRYNDLASENIVNRPNSIMMTKEIQRLLAYNIKIKYFMRYEKRLAEQKIKIKMKKKKDERLKRMQMMGKHNF